MSLSRHLRGVLIVASGAIIISFDALLVRLTGVDGWNVSFWRGLLMATSLAVCTPWLANETLSVKSDRLMTWLAAFTMAASSLALVLAFTMTSAANAVVILSAAPLFAAILSTIFLGEKSPARTWVAILVCMGGVAWVMAGSLGGGTLVGDLLAVVATLFIGVYFTVFRHAPEMSRAGVIVRGGLLLALMALPLSTPFDLPMASYGWLLLAGLVQMPLAAMLMTVGTRYLPAAEVSLFLLLETVLAPVWVWLVLNELPPGETVLGGSVIVATLALHTIVGIRGGRS